MCGLECYCFDVTGCTCRSTGTHHWSCKCHISKELTASECTFSVPLRETQMYILVIFGMYLPSRTGSSWNFDRYCWPASHSIWTSDWQALVLGGIDIASSISCLQSWPWHCRRQHLWHRDQSQHHICTIYWCEPAAGIDSEAYNCVNIFATCRHTAPVECLDCNHSLCTDIPNECTGSYTKS